MSGRYLLKMDFKEFFPSLRATDLERSRRRATELDADEIDAPCSILFWVPKVTCLICVTRPTWNDRATSKRSGTASVGRGWLAK